jgi:hypothetical protein
MTQEDRAYRGSTFQEVRDAIFANPYYKVWGGEGEPPLPVTPVTWGSVARGILPFGKPFGFAQAARRTLDSHADLRWGEDGKGVRRILHPNGVCLTGSWRITEATEYSGYFQQGSEGLTIARYSTCCTETRRGHSRSLSLVGKVYPTLDPGETTVPGAFITQQDIGGEHTDYVNDAETRNAPDTTIWRRDGISGPAILALTGLVFKKADREPDQRQTYELAELGKPEGEPTRAPKFLRFRVAEGHPRIAGSDLDFRDEVMAMLYDRGNPEPQRTLTFTIEVTDDGEAHGLPIRRRRTFQNWRAIGELVCKEAVVSHNGDHVIHMHHPVWRIDRNDPSTAIRQDGRRVRR